MTDDKATDAPTTTSKAPQTPEPAKAAPKRKRPASRRGGGSAARTRARSGGTVTSAGVTDLTDPTGTPHYPHAEGGPTYRTRCVADDETWPCGFAASKGAKAPKIERPDEITGPSIEGTDAHAITLSGKLTADELVAAGLNRDAAIAIEAAQDQKGGTA